jgi:uncharacterized protein YaiE (UPF0345 family)
MGLIAHSSELSGDVLWPESVTGNAVNELAKPLVTLLIDLGINPKPEDAAANPTSGTPSSVAIIEAGATAFSKHASVALTALGGVSVITAALATFWKSSVPGVQITLLAASGFGLAASLLAIALVVSADVRARGTGAAAQYEARARIADAYLLGAQRQSCCAAGTLNGESHAQPMNGTKNGTKAGEIPILTSVLLNVATPNGTTRR